MLRIITIANYYTVYYILLSFIITIIIQRVLFESYYNDNFGSSVDRTNIYWWDQILRKNWSHGTKIVAENIGPRTNFWWDQNFSDRTTAVLSLEFFT